MTVVYILAAFPKVSETFVSGEIAELRRRGLDVEVMSLRSPQSPGPQHAGTDELIRHTTYLPGTHRLLRAALSCLIHAPRRAVPALWWAIRRACTSRSRGDVLRFVQAAYISQHLPSGASHLHSHFAHGPATCTAIVSRLTGVPFSFTAHARDIFEYGDRRSLRDKTQAAKAVIAISEDGRQRLIELAGPEAADKIHLVRNGIDLTHFRRRTRNASGERILAVSRLVPKKGLDTLLRAVAMLVDRGRDVRCQIVGDGPLHDELRKAAKDLRIADRVEFSGSLDAGAVLGAYRHATVVALPCRTDENGDRDGLPVSIVEAMAVGVPVVSTRISGIPEVVEDGVSGLLVEPDDMRGLAAALERVLDDSKLRRSLADAGWCVAQDFDRRITTAELIAALGLPEPAPRTIRLDDVAVTDHVDLTEVVASAD